MTYRFKIYFPKLFSFDTNTVRIWIIHNHDSCIQQHEYFCYKYTQVQDVKVFNLSIKQHQKSLKKGNKSHWWRSGIQHLSLPPSMILPDLPLMQIPTALQRQHRILITQRSPRRAVMMDPRKNHEVIIPFKQFKAFNRFNVHINEFLEEIGTISKDPQNSSSYKFVVC